MKKSFGARRMSKPAGMSRAVVFPELALMGVETGDGRLLEEAGGDVRELPLTLYGQFANNGGHEGAVIVGTLDEVTFEDGLVSGYGWLMDDDNGHQMIKYLQTGALRGNSVDLAEVKAKFEWSDDDEMTVIFTAWKIAATTFVGKPAFGGARGDLLADEELVASWLTSEEPLVVNLKSEINVALGVPPAVDEIVASGMPRVPWEFFHQPETDKPRKFSPGEPNEDGFVPVYGHLALWNQCHDGIEGQCIIPPRADDDYASYNKPGVLTTKGMVGTGPVFLKGGHRNAPKGDYFDAYGGIENTWCDVRVTSGKLGPWLSGYVRPGVTEDELAAAFASRISGHWKGPRLKAIVCVNAEGYDVPGDGFGAAAFGFSTDVEGFVDEMVASFPPCGDTGDPSIADPNQPSIPGLDELFLELALQDME